MQIKPSVKYDFTAIRGQKVKIWSISSVDEDSRTAQPLLHAGGSVVGQGHFGKLWCELGTGDFPEFSQATISLGPTLTDILI